MSPLTQPSIHGGVPLFWQQGLSARFCPMEEGQSSKLPASSGGAARGKCGRANWCSSALCQKYTITWSRKNCVSLPQRDVQASPEALGFLYPPDECMSKLSCPKTWAGELTLVPERGTCSHCPQPAQNSKNPGSGRVGDWVSCVNVKHSLPATGCVNLLSAQ